MATFVIRLWQPEDGEEVGGGTLRGVVEHVGVDAVPRPFATDGELLDVLRAAARTPRTSERSADPAS